MSLRILAGNIGDAIEMNVVQDHQRTVARRDDVLFKVVGPHGVCQRLGRKRVLGQIAGGTTVGNDDRPHKLNHIK